MLRRVYLGVLLALVVGLSSGLSAAAAPGDDSERQDEVGQARERLQQLRMEADMAGQSHANAVFQLEKLDQVIAKKAEELKAAEEDLDQAEARLQERAAQMYKSGNVGFVDVLVGAEDFSEFANRLELWMRLIVQEKDEVESVRAARDEVAQSKALLEEKRRQRAATVEDAEAQRDKNAGLEADAQAYIDSLNAEVREAMEAEQARQAKLAKEKGAKLRAEIAESEPEAIRPPLAQAPQEESDPSLVPVRGSVDQALADRRAEREAAEEYAAAQAAEAEAARRAADQAEAAEQARLEAEASEAERRAALAEERAAARAAEEEEARLAAEQQYAAEQQAKQQDQYEGSDGGGGTATSGSDQYAGPQGGGTTPGGTTPGDDQVGAGDNQYGNGASTGAAGAQPSQPSVGAGGGTASGSAVVAEGAKYFGTPYVFGGPEVCVPYETMDCSCFTSTVYEAFGIALPDSPGGQMGYGSPVSGAPQAGDLVFFNEDGSGITHVAIATGKGTVVHASAFAGYAAETPIEYIDGYVGARRLL